MFPRPPRWYKPFVWAGLPVVVVATVASVVADPTGESALRIGFLATAAWMLIVLVVSWYVFFHRARPVADAAPGSASAIADIGSLEDPAALVQAMALDPATGPVVDGGFRRRVGWLFGFVALLVVTVLAGAGLTVSGVERVAGIPSPWLWAGSVMTLVGGYLVYMFVAGGYGRLLARGEEALSALGLRLDSTPRLLPVTRASGGTRLLPVDEFVMRGARRGRRVEVRQDRAGSTVTLEVATLPFALRSERGKLLAVGDVPSQVRDVLASLRPAPCWRGVEGSGDARGISVRRPVDLEHGWLIDLWLAERLGDRLSGDR